MASGGPSRFSIGDVERETGLSQRQIRYYERKGLVRPMRTPGGHRLYSSADVERLRAVATWLARGYNLAQARAALEAGAATRRIEELPAKEGFVRPETASLYPLRDRDAVLRKLRERGRDGE